MSNFYVRQMVEQWLQDPAMTVPFFPTINQDQDPLDRIWVTVDYAPGNRETLTFCENTTSEEGEVELIYFGPPGAGYTDILQALELDIATFMKQRDLSGRLVLLEASAPYEFSNGTAEREHAMSVLIDYVYYG